jgi:hypothetical protein
VGVSRRACNKTLSSAMGCDLSDVWDLGFHVPLVSQVPSVRGARSTSDWVVAKCLTPPSCWIVAPSSFAEHKARRLVTLASSCTSFDR